MASRTQLNKILLDIADCVLELKSHSDDGRNPINDDSTVLHRFQEKLELILLFGLIDKPGFLGPKKSYWNYICSCFASSKRSHDGINFVKSVVSLKTTLGCGRAFIRYCLVQKCLADTLQSCFMNQKISRDFYTELALPVQEKLWSSLVTSLYELNELNFDLCAGYTELDISWPKFARKLFTTLENEHKNNSAPDLKIFSAQDTFYVVKEDSESPSLDTCSNLNSSTINIDVVKLTEVNETLSQQNRSLQEEVECLQKEKLKLQCDIQALQVEYHSLQKKISNSKDDTKESNLGLSAIEEVATDFNSRAKTSENVAPETDVNDSTGCDEPQILTSVNSSIKSKTTSDMPNSSKCALPQNNSKMSVMPVLSSEILCKNGESTQLNRNICIPQSTITYITELLLEIKTVIDDIEDDIQKCDVTLAGPHICRLKRIRNCLEEKFSTEVDKSKSISNFNSFVDNCISCIKNFTSKQQDIINSLHEKIDLSIKQNQALYSKIKTLKNLLQSYGFLKVNEKEIEPDSVLLPLDATSGALKSYEDFTCDIAHDPLLKRIIVPLLPIVRTSFLKLSNLNEKVNELQFGLDSSQDLNNLLISRVQDQEMHLKGVTKEIEEAQQLVSVLKKQHRKLQSAEGILKYDLQEKRKLLTRLKQQLENTREDFNLVRIKNSKSEAEWQDLHKEFTERHRQSSTENGFVDDKSFEEQDTDFANSSGDDSLSKECTSAKDISNEDSAESSQLTKRNRLAMLEEQCQNLYSNLLQNSKKRQEIDKRLENISKTAEKNSVINADTFSSELSIESSFETVNDAEIQTSEDNCQTIIFANEPFTNSHNSSSDVGSLNSECSSCMPSICNDANSPDSCFCDSSKADSCISVSPCKSHTSITQPLPISEQVTEINSLNDSDCPSGSNSEGKEEDEMISSCESVELTVNTVQNLPAQSISHVDSILLKKKDLEESLKNLEIDNGIASPKTKECSISEQSDKQISVLEDERRHLLNQVQELERENLIISTQLHQTTQQLILSKSTKEHEVAALQFQLNAEALKYERSLKEFSEQSKGLDNMKKKVTEQEQLIFALEKALSEIYSDRESEKEQRWQELEDIHIALEAREQECITLCQELEKSMSEAEEEHSKNQVLMSQLEEFKAYNQKDKESMEAEIVHLQQYSVELQKKLIKLLKEKDILWKRSDHLYNLQKTKIDDRWMNDSEVSSCMACKSNFSFILRKHHCRLCGRIFCHSCANNWLMTASSSKKIRSCNECFMQQLEIKNVVRRGSDVPHIEDDSDGEAENNVVNLSLVPGSSSFNSDISSSINNSVLSLPIIQKQSTPQFSSAPDLRFVIKSNEVTSCSISLTEEKEENMPINNDDINKNAVENDNITSDECTSVTFPEDVPILLSKEKTKEEENLTTKDDINKDTDENASITSLECTSITVTEDCPKTCRLKEILVNDMKKCDISGKVAVHAGERVDLPIFCQTSTVELKWNFTSNCQTTPFTVTYEDESCNSSSTLLYHTTDKMQDQIKLHLPGYYVFHFVNSIRNTDLEVQYIFTVKHLE